MLVTNYKCGLFVYVTVFASKGIPFKPDQAYQSGNLLATAPHCEIALFCYRAMESSLSRLAFIAVVMLSFCCRCNQSAVLPNSRRRSNACEYI